MHRSDRGWLRAAVLGSNDAIISVSSLMIGIAATDASKQAILLVGVAGLVAGAMSMAVGEFVSVSSQRDAEDADIAKETEELADRPGAELAELAGIYRGRGLDRDLAMEVARQLTAHDPLGAHLRDELGIHAAARPRPLQAAWISALSFAAFALLPILGVAISPAAIRLEAIIVVTLASLGVLGGLGGWLGDAAIGRAAVRVMLGGGLAMALTFGVGRLLGVVGL